MDEYDCDECCSVGSCEKGACDDSDEDCDDECGRYGYNSKKYVFKGWRLYEYKKFKRI